jgi:hypothetical protein
MPQIPRWFRRQRSRFDLWRLQIWYREGYRDGMAGRRGAEGRALNGQHRIAYLTGWADGWREAGRPLPPPDQSDRADR